jgi:iron-sulfur cluster repair protein YtfE (RIC family)
MNRPSLTSCLEIDHRRLDAVLAECRSLASAASFAAAATRFEAFELGLSHHIRAEEEVLFPSLEAALPGAMGPTAVMRAEHGMLLGAVARVRAAFETSDGSWNEEVEQLEGLLVSHNRKEERVLYPMAERATQGLLSAPGLAEDLVRALDGRGSVPQEPAATVAR